MSPKATRWAREQRTRGPTEKAVLLVLADEADDTGMCGVTTRDLAKGAGIGQATVRRKLDALRDQGLITSSPGRGKAATTYQLRM